MLRSCGTRMASQWTAVEETLERLVPAHKPNSCNYFLRLLLRKLSGYHWQKDFIQSRIMEKVHGVGDKMNSQTWLEQVRMLAKERPISFTCIFFMVVLCALPVVVFLSFVLVSCALSLFSFIFFEGTLLAAGSVFLGGLFVVAACVAFPVAVFLFVTYLAASFAFSLFATTSTRIKKIVEERRRSSVGDLTVSSDRSCTDGSAFLPSCIIDSDASALRRTKGYAYTSGETTRFHASGDFYDQ